MCADPQSPGGKSRVEVVMNGTGSLNWRDPKSRGRYFTLIILRMECLQTSDWLLYIHLTYNNHMTLPNDKERYPRGHRGSDWE